MTHRMAAVLLALMVMLVVPGVASADRPVRELIDLAPDDVTDACGFPVLVHSEGTIVRTTWLDEDGDPVRAIETYRDFRYVLTNQETQEQVSVAIPGPAFYVFNADGSTTVTGTGPWGWYPDNPETGEPGIFLFTGRLTFTFDEENFSFDLLSGRAVNMCAAIA